MERDEIIKALERCTEQEDCVACPYDIECMGMEFLILDALSLIKELNEEAQTYKKHHDIMDVECSRLEKRNDELTEENERLRTAIPLWAKQCVELEERCMQLRADTVRKMQERLDKRFCHDPAFLGVEQRLIMDVIDQIAKEMLEEGK